MATKKTISLEAFDSLSPGGQRHYLVDRAIRLLPPGDPTDESRRCLNQLLDMFADTLADERERAQKAETPRTPEIIERSEGSHVPDSKVRLVDEAIAEIDAIARALHDHITKSDQAGTIAPLARGMLARVRSLGDAVVECLGLGDEWTEARIAQVVRATGGSEVAHG